MPDVAVNPSEFKLLRDFIEKSCGIALGEEKAYLVETRLAGLLAETGCADFSAFYRMVSVQSDPHLRDKLVDAMTTNETLWFRDGHPFKILKEVLLPPLAEGLKNGSRFRVRLWSGACSTGQEPYSLAMVIHEFCRNGNGVRPDQFEIIATDISPSALMLAKMGRYDAAAVARGLPDELRDRYFQQQGHVWCASDALKEMVSFKKYNLQDPPDALGRFDIVFMRYVTIYFSDDFKQRIYGNVARLLSPSGHLVISAVESLRGISDQFVQLSHAGGSYYRCQAS